MKFFRTVKNYEWDEISTIKREDPETGIYKRYRGTFRCNAQRTNSYYLGITAGRAKRLAKNHRLPFSPQPHGTGLVKLMDKLYMPAAKFKYNRLTKVLVISQTTHFKRKLVSKRLIED